MAGSGSAEVRFTTCWRIRFTWARFDTRKQSIRVSMNRSSSEPYGSESRKCSTQKLLIRAVGQSAERLVC